MISVRLPREIKTFKEKIYFHLTIRQLIFVAIGLISGVVVFWYGKGKINEDMLGWLVMLIAFVFGAFGFFNKNGMTFEKYLAVMLRFFFQPTSFKYKPQNPMEEYYSWEYENLKAKYKEINKKRSFLNAFKKK